MLQELLAQIDGGLMLGSVGGVSTGAVLTGAAQVNESIKEQVRLKISERKHFPHKQMSESRGPSWAPGRGSAEVCGG